jgi:hypothetical protein
MGGCRTTAGPFAAIVLCGQRELFSDSGGSRSSEWCWILSPILANPSDVDLFSVG